MDGDLQMAHIAGIKAFREFGKWRIAVNPYWGRYDRKMEEWAWDLGYRMMKRLDEVGE